LRVAVAEVLGKLLAVENLLVAVAERVDSYMQQVKPFQQMLL
jgi:hypothetical protein